MANNKEYMKKYHKEYYEKNKASWPKYSEKTPEQKMARSLYEKERYLKNKDKIRKHQESPKARFIFARSHAKHYGKTWDISFEDYEKLLGSLCHYCKSTLSGEKGVGLDRIDNSLGYSLNNVLPCCGTCNYIRQDLLSVAEMEVAMKAVIKFRKKNKE